MYNLRVPDERALMTFYYWNKYYKLMNLDSFDDKTLNFLQQIIMKYFLLISVFFFLID